MKKKIYHVRRSLHEWYEVEAENKKAAIAMPKDDPYAIHVISEVAMRVDESERK